jgi:hypothetical protein
VDYRHTRCHELACPFAVRVALDPSAGRAATTAIGYVVVAVDDGCTIFFQVLLQVPLPEGNRIKILET